MSHANEQVRVSIYVPLFFHSVLCWFWFEVNTVSDCKQVNVDLIIVSV